MKKIVAMLLVLVMAFSMAACGNENSNDASRQNQPETQTEDISDFSSENSSSQKESNAEDLSQSVDAQNATDSSQDDTSQNSSVNSTEADPSQQGSNILVAYFSRVGNTDWEDGVDVVTSASLNVGNNQFVGNAQLLAQMAQQATGGDLFLIETVESYPSDYRQTTDQAKVEQNDSARPALASHVENMEQYDTIVLIYPNWWGTLPQPLFTFLEEYDFSGKTILPLCTHEGSRMGSSESAIARLCPGATLMEGLSVRGSDASTARSEVEKWINESGILK